MERKARGKGRAASQVDLADRLAGCARSSRSSAAAAPTARRLLLDLRSSTMKRGESSAAGSKRRTVSKGVTWPSASALSKRLRRSLRRRSDEGAGEGYDVWIGVRFSREKREIGTVKSE